MHILNKFLAPIALGLSIAMSIQGAAAELDQEAEESIGVNMSKSDHETLASKYEAQAKDMRSRAQRHERTGLLYQGMEHGTGKGPAFARHCEALAANLRDAAGQSEEIAKLHRELAAQTIN